MADVRQLSRVTPWGIQHLNEGHNVWMPPWPHHPTTMPAHGKWLQDGEYPTQCTNHDGRSMCAGHGTPKITVPHYPLLSAFRSNEEIDSTLDLAERHNTDRYKDVKPSEGCSMIFELPVEIMRQILDYMLPSGQTFHFLPARDQKQHVQVVQRLALTESNEQSGTPTYLALAATCRELQDLIYAIVYGENDFIFNISAVPVRAKLRSSNFRKFTSWSRLLRQTPQPLGPLTARAATYIKKVTLLIALTPSHGTKDVNELEKLVTEAAEILTHCKRLQHLTIDFQLAPRVARNDDALSVDRLDVDFRDGQLEVGIWKPEVETVRRPNMTQRVLLPLMRIRGVRKLALSGTMSEDVFGELQAALLGPQADRADDVEQRKD